MIFTIYCNNKGIVIHEALNAWEVDCLLLVSQEKEGFWKNNPTNRELEPKWYSISRKQFASLRLGFVPRSVNNYYYCYHQDGWSFPQLGYYYFCWSGIEWERNGNVVCLDTQMREKGKGGKYLVPLADLRKRIEGLDGGNWSIIVDKQRDTRYQLVVGIKG